MKKFNPPVQPVGGSGRVHGSKFIVQEPEMGVVKWSA
jgi:hypothetical protein